MQWCCGLAVHIIHMLCHLHYKHSLIILSLLKHLLCIALIFVILQQRIAILLSGVSCRYITSISALPAIPIPQEQTEVRVSCSPLCTTVCWAILSSCQKRSTCLLPHIILTKVQSGPCVTWERQAKVVALKSCFLQMHCFPYHIDTLSIDFILFHFMFLLEMLHYIAF